MSFGIFLLLLAVLTLAGTVTVMAVAGLGALRIPRLRDEALLADPAPPRVSVVIAARDEADAIETALRSVLALDADLEVIVVDDRSTDGTGDILDRMARSEPHLRVVHVRELPAGWLGKTHALHRGAEIATGELLLFTDADVVMHPRSLREAVAVMRRMRLDHLAVGPAVHARSVPLQAAIAAFSVYFGIYARPWSAANPRSRHAIGVGAFNLVRTDMYRRIGGHTSIAMWPDDDMALARRLKAAGARTMPAFGRGRVTVEWYRSVRDLVNGLMKNTFAGLDYSVPRATVAVLAILALQVWPFVAVFLTSGATRILNLATSLLLVAFCSGGSLSTGLPPWIGLLFPFGALLQAFIILRSMILTLRQGGIVWRGTLYPLEELKAHRARMPG